MVVTDEGICSPQGWGSDLFGALCWWHWGAWQLQEPSCLLSLAWRACPGLLQLVWCSLHQTLL